MYSAIQDRGLTDNISQYVSLRKENSIIFDYLKKFPILPEAFNVQIVSKWEFDAFNLQKISYLVESKLRIFAYLLLPSTLKSTSSPGILALHQHNDEYKAGKSETVGFVRDPEYTKLKAVPPDPQYVIPESKKQFAYARELCERGFIVLAPDLFCFEEYREKNEYYEDPGFLRGYEEMISGRYILYGSCLMAKHLHDLYVAVSVLSMHNQVNSDKIGVIGHSLGGEMASVLTGFDKRIRAGVSSCGTVSYDQSEKEGWMESAETIIPGFREESLDFDFFLDMIPPTPFLATHGTSDAMMTERFFTVKRKNFESLVFEGGHEFPKHIRDATYDFLEKHLF